METSKIENNVDFATILLQQVDKEKIILAYGKKHVIDKTIIAHHHLTRAHIDMNGGTISGGALVWAMPMYAHITIENGIFETPQGTALKFCSPAFVTIRNCIFKSYTGICANTNVTGLCLHVDGCHFECACWCFRGITRGNGNVTNIHGGNFVLNNCYMRSGVSCVQCHNVKQFVLSNCVLEDHGLSTSDAAVVLRGHNMFLSNCTINWHSPKGIRLVAHADSVLRDTTYYLSNVRSNTNVHVGCVATSETTFAHGSGHIVISATNCFLEGIHAHDQSGTKNYKLNVTISNSHITGAMSFQQWGADSYVQLLGCCLRQVAISWHIRGVLNIDSCWCSGVSQNAPCIRLANHIYNPVTMADLTELYANSLVDKNYYIHTGVSACFADTYYNGSEKKLMQNTMYQYDANTNTMVYQFVPHHGWSVFLQDGTLVRCVDRNYCTTLMPSHCTQLEWETIGCSVPLSLNVTRGTCTVSRCHFSHHPLKKWPLHICNMSSTAHDPSLKIRVMHNVFDQHESYGVALSTHWSRHFNDIVIMGNVGSCGYWLNTYGSHIVFINNVTYLPINSGSFLNIVHVERKKSTIKNIQGNEQNVNINLHTQKEWKW